MSAVDPIVGYSDFARRADGQLEATALRESGASERTTVRVTVEREHRRNGEVIASGVVADSDPSGPGAVRI